MSFDDSDLYNLYQDGLIGEDELKRGMSENHADEDESIDSDFDLFDDDGDDI